ncbi:uncharacterized protein LOC118187077 isoform X2 [Stegodyphus dumicola]|uniref:uncharacterized protein LOC118187077 isoform X2 n=1 Tax=Stegodyphus dumicola TaxID=202533 RepID=UPI0015AE7DF7|nr:uncharacterized protein LOC118187077 isoform X2 [Stegodyphus dumicola]
MSRRLLQRGRYPKGPGIEQMTNPSSQVPSTTSPACPPGPQMPYYGSSVQTESPVNEPWNWKPENNIESSSYNNYQQPPPLEQWQQVSYSQVDNQNYSSQSQVYNPSAHQVYQPVVDYQTGNNNTNTILPNTSGSAWENGELSITQPEQLPWTYGAPQYCNPSYSTTDFPQNSNAVPTNTSMWKVNSDQQSISTSNHMQEESSVNYLSSGSTNLSGVASKVETITSEQTETSKLEVDNDRKINTSSIDVNISDEKINNPSEYSGDNDYGSSTLSAFFQSRDVDNSSNNSESGVSTSEIKATVDLTSLEEEVAHLNMHENESNSHHSEEHELDIKSDEENLENNFLQEENINDLDGEGGRELEPDSPVGSVEEPVNQEVPEPHTSDSSKLQQKGSKQNNKELPLEEPLNQQIPAESGQKSRSASCEPEKVIIRPREESPFKPPRGNNNLKSGAIVQQEKSAVSVVSVQKHAEAKASEGKTIVQEVNLETFPDNLERPPDYEELRKLSPLYVSHQKHLRNELNNSPSSLLCDNPDIPYVSLAPAAPPLHSSSKSDKSESSGDSKPSSNTGSLYNFVPSGKTQWPSLNESNVPVMLPSMPSSKTDLGEKRLKTNQLSATSSSEIKATKVCLFLPV